MFMVYIARKYGRRRGRNLTSNPLPICFAFRYEYVGCKFDRCQVVALFIVLDC